jgi:hypothetical protein
MLPIVASFSNELEWRIDQAKQRVDVTGRTLGVLVVNKWRMLKNAADRGVRLRLLIVDPQSPFGKQEQHLAQATLEAYRGLPPQIELRLSQRPFLPRIARLDELLLVELAPDAASPMRTQPDVPTLLVSERSASAVYSSFTTAFERAWSEAAQVSSEQSWSATSTRLRAALEAARKPSPEHGHSAVTSGFELEQAILQMFPVLPRFEVRLDVESREYDLIAFDLDVGDPILVEIKAWRRPISVDVAAHVVEIARSSAATVLLLTTTALTPHAAAVLGTAREEAGLRVQHLEIARLADCTTAQQAADLLRRTLRDTAS